MIKHNIDTWPSSNMAISCKVAVIGAGPAGLVAARELGREGHRVTVFEQGDRVGGTWIYTPQVESDPLGQDMEREAVHSSLYKSLRTNLPRKIMGFLDYPFDRPSGAGDEREFPGHDEVLAFLEGFVRHFGLMEVIRFGRKVVKVEVVEKGWVVEWRKTAAMREAAEEEVFDAVVICNGHFTEPYIAAIPGIERWQGKQLHSHNYRIPDPFQGQIVVVIGNGPSALDISRDVATMAKEVHLAARSPSIQLGKLLSHKNMWQHSMVIDVKEDGLIIFQHGTSVVADTILYCTGYKYSFPFLNTNGYLNVDDNRAHPLYKHVFPPRMAPWLSFIGIPSKVVPFLMKELQAKWVACVLSGKIALPSEEDMMISIEEDYYLRIEKAKKPKHQSHFLHPYEFEYKKWLVDQVRLPPLEPWIEVTYRATIKYLLSNNDGFRDLPSKL